MKITALAAFLVASPGIFHWGAATSPVSTLQQSVAPEPVIQELVHLSPSTNFSGRDIDGVTFELKGIGRKTKTGYAFWDPSGAPMVTPDAYGKSIAVAQPQVVADTILIVQETWTGKSSFRLPVKFCAPMDVDGKVISQSASPGDPYAILKRATNGDIHAQTYCYPVPISIVQANGKANFELSGPSQLTDVVEELSPIVGPLKSKVFKNLSLASSSFPNGMTRFELKHPSSYPQKFLSGYRLSALVLRDPQQPPVRVPVSGYGGSADGELAWFDVTSGKILKIYVEKYRETALKFKDVPMAPSGRTAPATRVPKISFPKIRIPQSGEFASAATDWIGQTKSGITYYINGFVSKESCWVPNGIPVMPNIVQYQEDTHSKEPNTCFDLVTGSGENIAFPVIAAFDERSGKPLNLKFTPSMATIGGVRCNRTYSFTSSEAPDQPVTLKFTLRKSGSDPGSVAEIRGVMLKRAISNPLLDVEPLKSSAPAAPSR